MDPPFLSCWPRLATVAIAGVLILFQSTSACAQTEQDLLDKWAEYQKLVENERWVAALDTAGYVYDAAGVLWESGDPRIAALAINYASLLHRQGYEREAREVLELSLREFGRVHGSESMEQITLIVAQGDIAARPTDASEQINYYESALSIVSGEHGRRSVEYADLALELGQKVTELSRSGDGEGMLKEAHKIYLRELGPRDWKTGKAAYTTARLMYAKGNHSRAENLLEDSLKAFDTATFEGRSWNLLARKTLVHMYNYRGREDLATEQLIAMAEIMSRDNTNTEMPVQVFKSIPRYPQSMLRDGKEGSVDFVFTVTADGQVTDPVVESVNGDEAFVDPALDALTVFQYVPRFADGERLDTEGVQARVTFKIVD